MKNLLLILSIFLLSIGGAEITYAQNKTVVDVQDQTTVLDSIADVVMSDYEFQQHHNYSGLESLVNTVTDKVLDIIYIVFFLVVLLILIAFISTMIQKKKMFNEQQGILYDSMELNSDDKKKARRAFSVYELYELNKIYSRGISEIVLSIVMFIFLLMVTNTYFVAFSSLFITASGISKLMKYRNMKELMEYRDFIYREKEKEDVSE